MPNKKSFDLNNEENKTNRNEKLYQPKKCRWCKCIVLPLLAGFVLLLILANVDFTGDAYGQTSLETQLNVFTIESNIMNGLRQLCKEKFGIEEYKLSLEECLAKTILPSSEATGMKITDSMRMTADNSEEITSISSESSSKIGESTETTKSNNTDTTEIETNETSEEISESHEKITTTRTTAKTTPSNTPTEAPTTTSMPTSSPTNDSLYTIKCLNSKGNRFDRNLTKNIHQFSIYSTSLVSVQLIFSRPLRGFNVLYYTNRKFSHHQQIITNISIIINNLDPTSDYVFCLIEDINKNISPFDCKSYCRPEIAPQPWILKSNMIWIICLIVLATCLMLLLGIVLVISANHLKKLRNKNSFNKSSATQLSANNKIVSDISLRNFRNSQLSSYHSQDQPPDVIASQPNHNIYNDLVLYEDLTI